MLFQAKTVLGAPLALMILSSVVTPARGQAQPVCNGFYRALECPAGTNLYAEAQCWRSVNSLESVLNCVHYSGYQEPSECAAVSLNDQYDQQNWPVGQSVNQCMTPREVLFQISRHECSNCRIAGVIQTCGPTKDPRFIHCICRLHRRANAVLMLLSDRFPNSPRSQMSDFCERHRRRDLSDNEEPPGPPSDSLSPYLEDDGDAFYIDGYGRLLFVDPTDHSLLDDPDYVYPQPYYDTLYDNTVMERCYIYPYSNRVWCVQWLISEDEIDQYADATGAPEGASVDGYTRQTTVPSSQTIAPGAASGPSLLPATTTFSEATGPVLTATAETNPSTNEQGGEPAPTAASTSTKDSSAVTSFVAPLYLVFGVQLLIAVYRSHI